VKNIRLLHLYLGTFFAPAILFFTVTGALQTFSYHETSRGSDYQPPAWLASAGQIHKKQGLSEPSPSPVAAQPATAPDPTTPTPKAKPKLRVSWPLKWFVLFMSVGLVGTTLLGIYMAFKYRRGIRLIFGLLAAGTVLPIALLYLGMLPA